MFVPSLSLVAVTKAALVIVVVRLAVACTSMVALAPAARVWR